MIAFRGAFHGRTLGALSLTASKVIQRRGFAPLIPGVNHIDYPYCYRSRAKSTAECSRQPLEQLEHLFRQVVPPDEVAAIFVEPIQGEGGYIVPPPDFHRELKAISEKHGILYIADEVQSGMGRTGKMFAIEHFGVVPDIICLAKGIASGLPLGAMIARADIMTWPRGAHASTFGGNPVSCAASLVTIDLLEQSLMDNAAQMGRLLMQLLNDLAKRHPEIGDVRGIGLMVGAELVRADGSAPPPPNAELQRAMIQACFQRGLLLLGCGESTIRFCPPLVVDEKQVRTATAIFEEALRAV
jgi:4-aminobutyrate aminotransferase